MHAPSYIETETIDFKNSEILNYPRKVIKRQILQTPNDNIGAVGELLSGAGRRRDVPLAGKFYPLSPSPHLISPRFVIPNDVLLLIVGDMCLFY